MNEIDIQLIKEELISLNSLIDNYENNYLNIYHNINEYSADWVDGISIGFYEEKNEEKQKREISTSELRDLSEIYKSIVEQYEPIAKKINFKTNHIEEVLNNLQQYINLLKKIERDYSNLDTDFAEGSIISNINSEKRKVHEMIAISNNLKININDTFNKIIQIEKDINNKITNLKINIILQNNLERYN